MAMVPYTGPSHGPLEAVPDFPGSLARWSQQPAGDVVVFVHGFSGSALTTWTGFDDLLPLDERAAGLDLFFYAWDSLRSDIVLAAERLAHVLQLMSTDNFHGRRHRRVLVCAHSLGGLVTRIAIINGVVRSSPWVKTIRQVLFAPAHLGLAAGVLTAVASRLFISLAALQGDGFLLQELQHRSNLGQEAVLMAIRPRSIVQAEQDSWIRVGSYASDSLCTFVRGTDHTSVCKPTAEYRAPIEIVLSALTDTPIH